jgi:hypothetical protein
MWLLPIADTFVINTTDHPNHEWLLKIDDSVSCTSLTGKGPEPSVASLSMHPQVVGTQYVFMYDSRTCHRQMGYSPIGSVLQFFANLVVAHREKKQVACIYVGRGTA